MKTHIAKEADIKRDWYIIDATDKVPGRIATVIADKLRGKDRAIFSPHMDCGDFVIIINAEKVKITGNKMENKLYHRHSGFPGGYRNMNTQEMLEKKPEKVMELAIRGMLPRNRLRDGFMSKCKIYAGSEHPHEAQQPKPLKV